MIAVKNDLKILEDKNGKSLHQYEVEVINDEPIVTRRRRRTFRLQPYKQRKPANTRNTFLRKANHY